MDVLREKNTLISNPVACLDEVLENRNNIIYVFCVFLSTSTLVLIRFSLSEQTILSLYWDQFGRKMQDGGHWTCS